MARRLLLLIFLVSKLPKLRLFGPLKKRDLVILNALNAIFNKVNGKEFKRIFKYIIIRDEKINIC